MRGTEGMILAIKWAREKHIPFLGICLGFQLAVVEFARNVCSFAGATSTEFDEKTPPPIIIFMPEISCMHVDGTVRLGLRPTVFEADSDPASDALPSSVRKLYGDAPKIWEPPPPVRGEPRVHCNIARLAQDRDGARGMRFVGKSESGERMQVLELPSHLDFVGLQGHRMFCTRPLNPSPSFLGFVAAAAAGSVPEEQLEGQKPTFKPPHPEGSMVAEDILRRDSPRPAGEGAILRSEQ